MTSELGDCLNKMLPLSWRLLAGSKRRDLNALLVPLLSPATNQVYQAAIGRSQENGRPLSEKKETEDEQSPKKRLTLCLCSHRAGTVVHFLSSVDAVQMSAAGVWESETVAVLALFM